MNLILTIKIEYVKKKRQKRSDLFTPKHKLELEKKLTHMRKLFGDQNLKFIEMRRAQIIKGIEIEERNKRIAKNYTNHRLQSIAEFSQRRKQRAEEVLRKANLQRAKEHNRKMEAINRGATIRFNGVVQRHLELMDEKEREDTEILAVYSSVWMFVFRYFQILRGIKTKIFMARKLKLARTIAMNRTNMIKSKLKDWMNCMPPSKQGKRQLEVCKSLSLVAMLRRRDVELKAKRTVGKFFKVIFGVSKKKDYMLKFDLDSKENV
jgi:hypothetical protein